MRRLPQSNVEDNLSALVNLVPSISEELLVRLVPSATASSSCSVSVVFDCVAAVVRDAVGIAGMQTVVDQPVVVAVDTVLSRKFLLCDYNRDGDSFRHARAFPLLQHSVRLAR